MTRCGGSRTSVLIESLYDCVCFVCLCMFVYVYVTCSTGVLVVPVVAMADTADSQPGDSFDVPAKPTDVQTRVIKPPAASGKHLLIPAEVLNQWRHSSIPPVRWATDFSNCWSRWVFTVAACSPLVPLFVGGAYFDVRFLHVSAGADS